MYITCLSRLHHMFNTCTTHVQHDIPMHHHNTRHHHPKRVHAAKPSVLMEPTNNPHGVATRLRGYIPHLLPYGTNNYQTHTLFGITCLVHHLAQPRCIHQPYASISPRCVCRSVWWWWWWWCVHGYIVPHNMQI